MKNYRIPLLEAFGLALCLFLIGCNNPTAETSVEQPAANEAAAVTNPFFSIAPIEYAELAEKSIMLLGSLDFDAWGATLADDVVYAFPDGDQNTRTTLVGKQAAVDWYKNYKTVSGLQSMTMNEFNTFPLNVTGTPKGGALNGVSVNTFFSNTIAYKNASVPLRMNFSLHFNADKKIDRYTTYYDRTPIVKALGMDLLETQKGK